MAPVRAPSPSADPSSSFDRTRTHDALTSLWRVTVDRLTDLSIERYSYADDAPPAQVALLESRLAALRRTLVEVETELHQLRVAPSVAVG